VIPRFHMWLQSRIESTHFDNKRRTSI
jgi:hypothetical protein